MPAVPAQGSEPPPKRRRSRIGRIAGWTLAILVLLLALLVAAALAAVRTETGTRHLWQIATRLSAGVLTGTFGSGTLAHGMALRDVVFEQGGTRVKVDRVEGNWSFHWGLGEAPARLHVTALRVGEVEAQLAPAAPDEPATPLTLPNAIELPLAIDVDSVTLRRLALRQGAAPTGEPMVFSDLSGAAHSDGKHHRISIAGLETPYGKLTANGQLAGQAPFALSAEALLEGQWQKEAFHLAATVNGTLEAMRVDADASGDRIRARAGIDLTPFGAVPFTRLLVQGDRINPKLFSEGAPQANLTINAELKPVAPGATTAQAGAASQAAMAAAASGPAAPRASEAVASASTPATAPPPATPAMTVAGEVRIRNLEPGPLDADRLPVESMEAHVELSEAIQHIRELRVRLSGGGEIRGGGSLRAGRGGFDIDVRNLDPHALHGAIRSERLSGPVIVRLEPGRQSVALDLTGRDLKLFADAHIDPDALTLSALRASAGAGTLTGDGRLGFKDKQEFAFKGKLANLDPARLAAVAPGRINAEFTAAGTLADGRRVAVDFSVGDSEYAGLPMTGGGKIRLLGDRLLPSEANLQMAGNSANLRGSFGARGDRLRLAVDAPQLERLKFGVAGRLKVDADIAGTISRPEITADYEAQALAMGPHRVASASGRAEMRGGLQGPLMLRLTARDYRGPQVSVDKLDVSLDGTQANHTFALTADGQLRRKPMQLSLAGQGAWRGEAGWSGTISKLEERAAVNVRLTRPMQLAVADQRITVGATQLQFERATLTLDQFAWDHGRVRSKGTLDNLQMARVLEVVETITGERPPVRSDMVIDGIWDLNLAETAGGFAQLRRRSGDVTVDAGRGLTTLGVSEAVVRAEAAGGRINLRGNIVSSRIGRVDVDAFAGLVQQQGLMTVAPASSLGGQVSVDVPRIKSLEAFMGPQYAFDGKLAAALRLGGTVGEPLLTGNIDGEGLAVTLFDQGIRLTDGIVRVTLDRNVITMNQVEFRGGDGKVVATGNVKLDGNDPDLTARIVADRLQLFASPERTLIVSGEAGILNENGQVVIRGRFRVDRGLFDLPRASAPVLGDDVVVVRRSDQREVKTAATPVVPESAPTSRFSPAIDLTIDLGNDFRFRGAGADLLLAGQLGVNSTPLTPLRATGTVRVVSGTYEAFGRRLEIDRGIINFNGPINNPNINIRAMRRNQEVNAGVEVTGTVRLPRVRLVSEPNVPDEDKLSWLMFGYGAESAGSGQQRQLSGAAIGGAALGMIGTQAGRNVVSRFGIDEFSIGPSTAGLNDQQVVSVGKSVTDRISVGYEQSLTSASNVVKLTWALSRRWSLIAKGGSINGLSLLFNRRFDNWGVLFSGASNRSGTTRSGQDDIQPNELPAAASAAAAEPVRR